MHSIGKEPASPGGVALQLVVPAPSPEQARLDEARALLAARLAEVSALDAQVEARSAELAAFAASMEAALGAADLEGRRAAHAVRRVQALAFGLQQLLTGLSAPAAPPRRRGARRPPRLLEPAQENDAPAPEPEPEPDEPLASEDGSLRRVYRRLARLLHPDLATSEADRERLTATMALVNAAYTAKDLQALELTAEKLGAGEPPGLVTDLERLEDLARRRAQLDTVAASLRRELRRLAESDTASLLAEAERRRAEGGDALADSLAELEAETLAARADVLARLAALDGLVATLNAARRERMVDLQRRGAAGVQRQFDPLSESGVVRRAASRLRRTKVGPGARALARWLEDAANSAVPDAALTLLAYFAEVGSEVPPPSLATSAGFAERWDSLRAAWPGAPDLATALGNLPPHLQLGARAGRTVHAGVQLASAELLEGVSLALEHPGLRELARTVLAALGPAARCETCATEVRALHLNATRGLDERHALVCPRCGAWLQRYWRFGALEGLEALWRHSLELGLTTELTARLGTASLSFGLLPLEREALTASALLARFDALYLAPNQVELPPGAVSVKQGGRALVGRAHLAPTGAVTFAVSPKSGTTAEALLELLRSRVERRFKP